MKRVGAVIVAPIVFLVLGYSLMYVIGQPVIQFVTSSLDLVLLTKAPDFNSNPGEVQAAVKETSGKVNEKNELPSSSIRYPRGGELYGKIRIDDLKIDEPLYFGDTQEILRYGAGQFMGSVYPGELGTSLVGGHNSSTFGKLLGIQPGTVIQVQTTYGKYTYQVAKQEIKNKDDAAIKQAITQKDNRELLLYTCYPIDSLGMTDERVFVTANLIDGPIINDQK